MVMVLPYLVVASRGIPLSLHIAKKAGSSGGGLLSGGVGGLSNAAARAGSGAAPCFPRACSEFESTTPFPYHCGALGTLYHLGSFDRAVLGNTLALDFSAVASLASPLLIFKSIRGRKEKDRRKNKETKRKKERRISKEEEIEEREVSK